MGVLVNFLPCEASVAAEEGVALGIWNQRLANVSDGHEHPNNRRTAIRGSWIRPFSVAVNVKGTLLLGEKIRFGSSERQAARTVPWHGYLLPCESTVGGVKGLHVLPVPNQ